MKFPIVEPDSMHTFWEGWLKWSVEAGIDYFIGRKIPTWLDSLGLKDVAGEGHTAQFNGGSDWARYWIETVRELTPSLLKSGHVTEKMIEEFYARYQDPHYWTSIMTFTANWDASRRDPRLAIARGLTEGRLGSQFVTQRRNLSPFQQMPPQDILNGGRFILPARLRGALPSKACACNGGRHFENSRSSRSQFP